MKTSRMEKITSAVWEADNSWHNDTSIGGTNFQLHLPSLSWCSRVFRGHLNWAHMFAKSLTGDFSLDLEFVRMVSNFIVENSVIFFFLLLIFLCICSKEWKDHWIYIGILPELEIRESVTSYFWTLYVYMWWRRGLPLLRISQYPVI